MKQWKMAVAVLVVGLIGAGVVIAAEGEGEQERKRARKEGGRPGPEKILAVMDKDGDGKVTLEEYTAFSLERAEERFKKMDADGDGVVVKEEMLKRGGHPRGPREGERKRGRRGGDKDPGEDAPEALL